MSVPNATWEPIAGKNAKNLFQGHCLLYHYTICFISQLKYLYSALSFETLWQDTDNKTALNNLDWFNEENNHHNSLQKPNNKLEGQRETMAAKSRWTRMFKMNCKIHQNLLIFSICIHMNQYLLLSMN